MPKRSHDETNRNKRRKVEVGNAIINATSEELRSLVLNEKSQLFLNSLKSLVKDTASEDFFDNYENFKKLINKDTFRNFFECLLDFSNDEKVRSQINELLIGIILLVSEDNKYIEKVGKFSDLILKRFHKVINITTNDIDVRKFLVNFLSNDS